MQNAFGFLRMAGASGVQPYPMELREVQPKTARGLPRPVMTAAELWVLDINCIHSNT